MRKSICLAILALFTLSAVAFAQSQGASTQKESKWTKTYESIARWGWKPSSEAGSSASTKSTVKKKSTEVSPKN